MVCNHITRFRLGTIFGFLFLFTSANLGLYAQCTFDGTLTAVPNSCTGKANVYLRNCSTPAFPTNYTFTITASGGSPIYSGVIEAGGACQTITFSNVVTGFYTLKINSTTCSSWTVDVPAVSVPDIVINSSRSPQLCEGESITLTASGGTSYQWYYRDAAGALHTPPPYITSGSSTSNSIIVTPLADTKYVAWGSTSCGGAKYSSDFSTYVTPKVSGTVISGITSLVVGTATTSSFTVTASNSTGQYIWSVTDPSTVAGISQSGVVTWRTDYSGPVVIKAIAKGCNNTEDFDTHPVTVDPVSSLCAFDGTFTNEANICEEKNDVWLRNCSLSFPSNSNFTFSIVSNTKTYVGTFEANAACQTIKFANIAQGLYTLHINNATCPNWTVNVPAPPTAFRISVNSSRSPLLCEEDEITLTGDGSTSSYEWYSVNATGGYISPLYIVPGKGTSTSSAITVMPTENSDYVVKGMVCGGYKFSLPFHISITKKVGPVTISLTNNATSMCEGQSPTTTFTASASNASGGYTWSVYDVTTIESISGGIVTWKSGYVGPVKILVSAKGCNTTPTKDDYPFTITAGVTPFHISATDGICAGQTGDVVLLNDPETDVTYQLFKDGSSSGNGKTKNDMVGAHLTWSGLSQGTYKIQGSKTLCPSKYMLDEKTILFKSPGTIGYNASDVLDPHCAGDPITFSALNGTEFKWTSSKPESWPNGQAVVTANPVVNTTYYLAGKESNCSTPQSKQFEVKVVPKPATPASQNLGKCVWDNIILISDNLPAATRWYIGDNTSVSYTGSQYSVGNLRQPGTYIYKAEALSDRGCKSDNKGTITLTIADDCSDRLNWIETISYKPSLPSGSEIIGHSKSYFDFSGKLLQSQSKSLSTGYIISGQNVKDQYGRNVINSLRVPLAQPGFKYQHYLLTDSDGDLYDFTDFNESVGKQPGTLGWYYSRDNDIEDHVPVTGYPYLRSDFYEDGTGETRKSGDAGEVLRLGAEHEVLSGTFPVFNELDDYLGKRLTATGITDDGSLVNEGVQNVSRDQNGTYGISISDKAGKTLMAARGGASAVANQTLVVNTTVIVSLSDRPILYFYLLEAQDVATSIGGVYKIENLEKNTIYEPAAAAIWPAGFYRIIVTSGSVSVSYKNSYRDIAYQFYDDAGRLKSSVSPNGYEQWKAAIPYTGIDHTTYAYNHQNWLLSMKEPDAGETEYVYTRDGKIRFSRNAEQKDKNKFSYTHYDNLGRPVESGEYKGTAIIFKAMTDAGFATSPLKTTELERTFKEIVWDDANAGNWKNEFVLDRFVTHYDKPVTFSIAYLPSQFRNQQYIRGAISWTENANMKTWFSYDELGRIAWVARKPTKLDRTFMTQYTYDAIGNVVTVYTSAYRNNAVALEEFYHHYEYDNDGRLVKSYTGLDAAKKQLRATYYYYLHGPLKRIELGDNKYVQGIDFVYNINGWLTHINHPDPLSDPGKDANDAFGMVLDYYESAMTNLFSVNRNPGGHDPLNFHRLPEFADLESRDDVKQENLKHLQNSLELVKRNHGKSLSGN
jgi:hypothetical protein